MTSMPRSSTAAMLVPQALPGLLVGDRPAVAFQLVRSEPMVSGAGGQAARRQLHVAPARQRRADRRLIEGLVGAETHVSVGPKHTTGTELLGQLVEKFGHRLQHLLLVHLVVGEPVGLGIVEFQAPVEVECCARPAVKGHDQRVCPARAERQAFWLVPAR